MTSKSYEGLAFTSTGVDLEAVARLLDAEGHESILGSDALRVDCRTSASRLGLAPHTRRVLRSVSAIPDLAVQSKDLLLFLVAGEYPTQVTLPPTDVRLLASAGAGLFVNVVPPASASPAKLHAVPRRRHRPMPQRAVAAWLGAAAKGEAAERLARLGFVQHGDRDESPPLWWTEEDWDGLNPAFPPVFVRRLRGLSDIRVLPGSLELALWIEAREAGGWLQLEQDDLFALASGGGIISIHGTLTRLPRGYRRAF